jgi:hypothetical protein
MFSVGFLLLLVLWVFGKKQNKINGALKSYILIWFIVCAINMSVGIIKAGYTFMEELPIFLMLFGIPALLAVFLFKSNKK